MPNHLVEKPPITPDPIPTREEALGKIQKPQNRYYSGLVEDNMSSYMFEKRVTGEWSQDDYDDALDTHAEAMKLITMGAGAAAVGAAADLTAFGTTILYNGYNMARGGEWTWPEDMRDVPLTQEWWGAQLGLSAEQTGSLAFIGAGIAIAPTKLDAADAKFVAAALKTAKGLGGSRGAALQRSADAARMLDEGVDETEVWRKTGWWRDPADGKMKFAISDADAVLDHEMIAQQALNKIPADYSNKDGALIELRADQVLKHDALYELYPQLAGYPVTVRVKQNADGVWELANKDYRGGSYNRETNMIIADSRDPRRTLVHEMQHAIQDFEGMAGGGAIDLFTKSARGFRLADFMHQMYKKPEALLDFDGPEDIAAYIKTIDPSLPDEQALSFANKLDRVAMGDMSEAQMNQDIWDWGMQVEVDGKKFMRWMEQVKLFPEEVGTDIKTLMTELDDDTLQAYALVRYLSESGEVEARITESLMHLPQEQLDKLTLSPRLLRPYLNRSNVERANKQGVPLQTMRASQLEPQVAAENAAKINRAEAVRYPTGAKTNEQIDAYIPIKGGPNKGGKQFLPMLKNPTKSAFLRWINKQVPKQHRGDMEYDVRFAEDADGNIYVWDSYLATHEEVESAGFKIIEGDEDSIEGILNWLPESSAVDEVMEMTEEEQGAFLQSLLDKDPTLVARLMEMLDNAPVRNAE